VSSFLDSALGRKPEEQPAEGYKAFHASKNSRPQMGFSIIHANGDMDGFMYHTLAHLRFETIGNREFLSFTHAGLAVVIEGVGLKDGYKHIMRHTLLEIHEHAGRQAEPVHPVILRVDVTDTQDDDGSQDARKPAARLVK
jgi:hypothetical protein